MTSQGINQIIKLEPRFSLSLSPSFNPIFGKRFRQSDIPVMHRCDLGMKKQMSRRSRSVIEDMRIRKESFMRMVWDDGVTGQNVEMVHVAVSIDHDDSPVVWKTGGEELSSSTAWQVEV